MFTVSAGAKFDIELLKWWVKRKSMGMGFERWWIGGCLAIQAFMFLIFSASSSVCSLLLWASLSSSQSSSCLCSTFWRKVDEAAGS